MIGRVNRRYRNMKKTIVTVTIMLLAFISSVVAPAEEKREAPTAERLSIEILEQELGLDEKQVRSLQSLFNSFYHRKIRLLEEMQTLEPAEAFEKQSAMQKQFYKQLGAILTPVQVENYKRMMGIKAVRTEITIDQQQDRRGNIPAVKRSKVFPSLIALKNVIMEIELSGLQREAIEDFFSEIEKQASQMQYWDPAFDPTSDPSFATLIQSKLLWVLTESQYREFVLLVRHKASDTSEEDPELQFGTEFLEE